MFVSYSLPISMSDSQRAQGICSQHATLAILKRKYRVSKAYSADRLVNMARKRPAHVHTAGLAILPNELLSTILEKVLSSEIDHLVDNSPIYFALTCKDTYTIWQKKMRAGGAEIIPWLRSMHPRSMVSVLIRQGPSDPTPAFRALAALATRPYQTRE